MAVISLNKHRDICNDRKLSPDEWVSVLQHDLMNYIFNKGKFKTIANKTGLCSTTISNIASGQTVSPRLSTVIKLLRFFKYDVYAIAGK